MSPVLYRQAEVRRHGWPDRQIPEEICRRHLRQLGTEEEGQEEVASRISESRLSRTVTANWTVRLFSYLHLIDGAQYFAWPTPYEDTVMSGTIRDTLEEKLARFEQLERNMSDPEVLADGAR